MPVMLISFGHYWHFYRKLNKIALKISILIIQFSNVILSIPTLLKGAE